MSISRRLAIAIAALAAGLFGGAGVWLQPMPVTAREGEAPPPPSSIKLIRTLQAGKDKVLDLSFSPDGTLLMAVSGANLLFWDARTGESLRQWASGERFVCSATYLNDGRVVMFSGGSQRTAVLREATNGKEIKTIDFGRGTFLHSWALASKHGPIVTTAGRAVTLWDLETWSPLWQVTVGRDEPRPEGVAFSPDRKTLAVGFEQGYVRLYRTEDGREIDDLGRRPPRLRIPILRGLSFSPTEQVLAVGERDESVIRVFDFTDRKTESRLQWDHPEPKREPFESYRPPPSGINDCLFSPDGKTLVAVCNDGKLRFFDTLTWSIRHVADVPGTRAAFSPCGRLLVVGSMRGEVRVFDWRNPDAGARAPQTPGEIERHWRSLASKDAVAAYQAIASLAADPDQAVNMAAKHLKPARAADAETVAALITELDDPAFAVREAASGKLKALGTGAVAQLRQEMRVTESAEVRGRLASILSALDARTSPSRLRDSRAIELLEHCGTPAAADVLRSLASGVQGARLTEDAAAALARLKFVQR